MTALTTTATPEPTPEPSMPPLLTIRRPSAEAPTRLQVLEDWHNRTHGAGLMRHCQQEPCRDLRDVREDPRPFDAGCVCDCDCC